METRLLTPALLAIALGLSAVGQAPGWNVQLETIGLQRFDRDPVMVWLNQQGVVFLGSDRLLVYQVGRTPERARLGPRDANGGAGNFLLNIKVLSSQDGHLIRSMSLVTNAATSQVLPTREGLLIRSGYALTLYSPSFEPLATRTLKLEKQTETEEWQVRVSPSGENVVLLHEQVLSTPEILADGSVVHDGAAKVNVEILDAATLEPRKNFTLSHTMPFWSPSNRFLVSSNPAHSYSDGQVGLLDFEGKWSPIHTDFKMPKSSCGYAASTLDEGRIVVHGCETFTVLTVEGDRVFSKNDGRFAFISATASGRYLALQCDRYRTGLALPTEGSELPTDIDRIQVFDIDTHKRVLSYRLHKAGIYYALSPQGNLVVADGSTLSLTHPEQ
jgi:hypothetical protein